MAGGGGGGRGEDDVMCSLPALGLPGGRGWSLLTLQFPAGGWNSLRSRPDGKESGSFKLGEGGWAADQEASVRIRYHTARGGASLCKSELLIADAQSPHARLCTPIGRDEPGPIDNKRGYARPGGVAAEGADWGGGIPPRPSRAAQTWRRVTPAGEAVPGGGCGVSWVVAAAPPPRLPERAGREACSPSRAMDESGELGGLETMETLTELGDELTLGDIDGEWWVGEWACGGARGGRGYGGARGCACAPRPEPRLAREEPAHAVASELPRLSGRCGSEPRPARSVPTGPRMRSREPRVFKRS